MTFRQEAHETALAKQREDLQEWKLNLQEGQDRLLEDERLLKQREDMANEKERAVDQKEKYLEAEKKKIEVTGLELKEKEADISIRIPALSIKEKVGLIPCWFVLEFQPFVISFLYQPFMISF